MNRWWMFSFYLVVGSLSLVWLVKVPLLSYCFSKDLRLPILMEWISVWPTETEILNFSVKNPQGFEGDVAFKANNVKIDYQVKPLLGDPSVIDAIVLDAVFLSVEFVPAGGKVNNWTVISNGMPKKSNFRPVQIRNLIVTNLSVEIQGLGSQTITKHVPQISLQNLSSQHGFPTEALIQKVFGSAGLSQYIQGSFTPLDLVEDVVDPLHIFE